MRANSYRGGKVHVLAEKCSTCIFRPGKLMTLQPGRVKGSMVDESIEQDAAITCHKTLYREGQDTAVCRGFFDAYGDQVLALRLATRCGIVEFDPEPTEEVTT